MAVETSVNASLTQEGFCCTGDKVTLLATKQSILIPDGKYKILLLFFYMMLSILAGCTRILVKNKVMSTQ